MVLDVEKNVCMNSEDSKEVVRNEVSSKCNRKDLMGISKGRKKEKNMHERRVKRGKH